MDPVNDAIAYTAEHGGGTFEADTLLPFTPSSGYAVGYGGARISANVGTNVIGMLLKVIPEEYEASFVGTWLSGDVIHIDAVQYFADYRRDAAIAFAASTGQEAIYDFAAGESIYLQEV